MALNRLTQITSSGISSTSTITVSAVAGSITGVVTATSLTVTGDVTSGMNVSGIVTATTVQVGSATTIHTTGIDLGSGNITSHNINSTGIVTATSFVGPVTGNVTGDLTGNVSSSGANTLGSLTVTNDATVGGALTVTGDLTVNGTTTTIDTAVTAVDSLAIDGNASVGGSVGIGTDNPNSKLEIWNNSNIEVLRLRDTHFNKYLTIRGGGSPNRMVIDAYEGDGGGADIDLASNGSTKVRITSSGDILLTGGDGRKISFADDGSAHYFKMDNTFNGPVINGYGGIKFETNGTNERLRISSGGDVSIGTTISGGWKTRIQVADSASYQGINLTNNTNADLQFEVKSNESRLGPSVNVPLLFKTGNTEKLRITSDGLIGINHQNPTVGLSINKFGTQPVPSGNTYTYPAGNWSTVWNYTTTNNTDYWCGFAGGYDVSSATVNISLSPNVYNFNTQAGIYIAGEATSNISADFTIGKLIGGSVAGISTVAGTQRATKSEMFRITSAGRIGIGISSPQANLDVFNTDSATAGTHGFQMGAFGIRTNDTGGYNHWYIERNYGGWQSAPLVTLKGNGQVAIGTSSLVSSDTFEVCGTTRLGTNIDYGSTTVLNVAPGTVKWDTTGASGGRLTADNNGNWILNGNSHPVYSSIGVNMNDIYGATTSSNNMGSWVYLGTTEHSSPYPRKAYKISAPNSSQGTFVYQVWFNGDANYVHGGLYEIRINNWSESTRFTSVTVTCINGVSSGLRVYAYNDTNGIWISTDSIWGSLYIRKFGYDDGVRSRGSSLCAVDNGGALAQGDVNGLSGSIPGGYTEVHANDSAGGGYNIESNYRFQAGQGGP